MRQRAISAAVLVPVLLVVLFFGGVVLAAAVALITVLAAMEAFKLLKGAGYTPFASLGMVLALVVVLDAAFPNVLEGSGLLLVAVGIVLAAVASFTRIDPKDGLQAWMTTVFGALYVSLLSFIIRLGQSAPVVPRRCAAERARRRARLDPAPRARGLVVRHGRLSRRQEHRPDASS